jgi:hypothetical protein
MIFEGAEQANRKKRPVPVIIRHGPRSLGLLRLQMAQKRCEWAITRRARGILGEILGQQQRDVLREWHEVEPRDRAAVCSASIVSYSRSRVPSHKARSSPMSSGNACKKKVRSGGS